MSLEPEDFPLVTDKSRELLKEKQVVDYEAHRIEFVRWLIHLGKNPDLAEGYGRDTIRATAYRTDQFARQVWTEQEDGYTASFTHDHADAYMTELLYSDNSATHKANTQKALKRLFKWRAHEKNGQLWEPERTFSNMSSDTGPREFLTIEERKQIREAALDYGSIPSYSSVSTEDRDAWKAHLAQRFGKPKSEVTPEDWDRANSWKFTSMTWASLDCGLRPIEVERAKVSWVDVENSVLRIPKEDSAKNEGNWVVALSDRTADALERWLGEREQYEKYDNTDTLWLTREGNPYQTQSLRRLLVKLCEIAGIPTESRKMSWYALRHSTGTAMTHERDLAAAKAQLRHKSEQTTMKYDQAPVEDRREALDRMG
ncbi:tyrosine-type recombinase/integrase [Halopelagius longus]|uniref:Site-specific integrase n=1 Tax=Halopelagius longus TaxID=1236180 RepID=A0A1H0Z969_9EURY|nr:site-specific integrase [Halopelagius longus]RDI72881.1 site-specific integrase [Halopelagius longus]SDQ23676.1 Site-specific recombinase XerD [Halopelagius longus]